MNVVASADVDPTFAAAVHDAVVGLGDGDTEVLDVEVAQIEDLTESAAWRVTLFLQRPRGESWDVERTREVKRSARDLTDSIAADRDQVLEGLTSVVLTTDQAPESEVAPPDEPEPEESAKEHGTGE